MNKDDISKLTEIMRIGGKKITQIIIDEDNRSNFTIDLEIKMGERIRYSFESDFCPQFGAIFSEDEFEQIIKDALEKKIQQLYQEGNMCGS